MSKFGRFEILGKIGVGGFGVVYKGYDASLDRHSAVKVMSEPSLSQEKYVARFKREAKAAAALNHPNVVQIYELGEQNGLPFLAMEFLAGQDLSKVLQEKQPLPFAKVVDIVKQVAEGLDYAHSKGIFHRDIKLANLRLLDDGSVKIMDFGLAVIEDSDLTRSGELFGSISYMSPEQINGEKVDGRSDLYSLGVVFYEMLSRRRPYAAPTHPKILLKVLKERPPDLLEVRGTEFSWLEPIVFRCLEKEPDKRFDSCRALITTLSSGAPRRAEVPRSGPARPAGPAVPPIQKVVGPAEPEGPSRTAAESPPIPTLQPPSRNRRSLPLVLGAGLTVVAAVVAAVVIRDRLLAAPAPTVALVLAPSPTAPPPPTPVPEPTIDPRVPELLREAREHARANRWTEPEGECALDNYRQALLLAPENEEAVAGVLSVQEFFLRRGDELMRSGAFAAARVRLDKARRVRDEPRVGEAFARLTAEEEAVRLGQRQEQSARQAEIASRWDSIRDLGSVPQLEEFLRAFEDAPAATREEATALLGEARADEAAFAAARSEGTGAAYERYLARNGRKAHLVEAKKMRGALATPPPAIPSAVAPVVLARVSPRYPEFARKVRREGTVVIKASIDPGGAVVAAQVVAGSDKLLDEAAIEAVRKWSFQPATVGGRPVKGELTVSVNFKLQ